MQWVIKISVVVAGLTGMGLAFFGNNMMTFRIVSTALIYTVILPQLICVLLFRISNIYGAVGGCVLGVLLRLLSGEPLLYLPPAIHFPDCRLIDGVYVQHFPAERWRCRCLCAPSF
ncbi:hypothetical protein AAFF_G00066170 [Aldrovandia affinis]|uniref:Uncharacterized protein n=1 Tax=Aldrovandia affinis TaxID=143900 RepID=A0AAD7T3Z1_9TELE|nr:hypothetical protein AAFF_G00066170 [Aldrovandia affinis]